MTQPIPWGPKFLSKLLYLGLFEILKIFHFDIAKKNLNSKEIPRIYHIFLHTWAYSVILLGGGCYVSASYISLIDAHSIGGFL